MELSCKELMYDTFVIVHKRNSTTVGRIDSISKSYNSYKYQGYSGLDGDTFGRYCKAEAFPLIEELLELEGWAFDGLSNCWTEPSCKRVSIFKNTDGYSQPWRVHIDNEDMDTIGNMDFTYLHQLQGYCALAGAPISFKLGSVTYIFNKYKESLMVESDSKN